MDAGVFCVNGVGTHFFFLAVFAVDAVMQLRHVGGCPCCFTTRGPCWHGLSLHIHPSTPDGKTCGLGFKWGVVNVAP